jgi:mRNA interferase RelE/StbE
LAQRYAVQIVTSARRQLLGLPDAARQRVRVAIRHLAGNPRPAGAKLLAGRSADRLWRTRVGEYRVHYEIRDTELIVVVIRIGHRREVYRRGS